MSSEDGANCEAEPSSSIHSAEKAHGGTLHSFTAVGCDNSGPCDSPWDPWTLLQSQCNPNSTCESPGNDDLVGNGHTFSKNTCASNAHKQNPPLVVDNSINSVNLDTGRDRDKLPLLGPTAQFDQQTTSGCSDLSPTNLGSPRKYCVVQSRGQHTNGKGDPSDLLPAKDIVNGFRNTTSIRYPFEIFSEEGTSKSEEEEHNSSLSGKENSDNSKNRSHCIHKLNVRDEKSTLNTNNTTSVYAAKEKWTNISNDMHIPNGDRQPKQIESQVFQNLDHPHTNTRVVWSRSDLQYVKPLSQSGNQSQNVPSNIFGLSSPNITQGSCRTPSQNPRFTSANHYLPVSIPCTNPSKDSSHQPSLTAASDASLYPNLALPPIRPTNYESDRLRHSNGVSGFVSSKINHFGQLTTNREDAKAATPPQSSKCVTVLTHKCSASCELACIKQNKLCPVSQSAIPPPTTVSSDECCQDKRCSSSRPHPNTGTRVVAESTSAEERALHLNTAKASNSTTVKEMAGQNHHHLSRTVMDESAPRVPVHPPPLDNNDVMGLPERNDLLFQDQDRTSSISTSFADLMLGDHTALRHKGRDGRLGRCGEGRDSRLYGLSEASTISNLRETVLALQLQNTQLSLCLQQERSRREQAENLVDQEKGYIKRLEDTIQTLKSTRLVIDPNMYRQIAESYIASRKTPVRRTCSSSQQRPGHYEDLVCDSSPDNSLSPSPTSPNSSTQFLINDAIRPGASNPTYSSASSTCANDPLATLPPLPSASTSRLPSQTPIFNERQDLRWPSDRGETSLSSGDDYLFKDSRSASSPRNDTIFKRRDV